MKLYNLKYPQETTNFIQAVQKGLGRDQGLFFPEDIPVFDNIDELLALDFVSRSTEILHTLIGDELTKVQVGEMVEGAFSFDLPLKKLASNKQDQEIYALELFHGPTLAFKDFGGRFMAQSLARVIDKKQASGDKVKKITILTATSGDTGAAVAHAFYDMPNINVVVLYPKGKISPLQEKLFCTLGQNIHTLAVDGDFDACQALVKQAFDDDSLREEVGLNSANSINISRLMAQICYYFEAIAQLPKEKRHQVVISVPSGNFGNLTAGLIAKAMGLPVKRFIAATNANDTVPRYLDSGNWLPKQTTATLSNAMDVSQPNNWPRIEVLFNRKAWSLDSLGRASLSDKATEESVKYLYQLGYLSEPHGAIAYQALSSQLQDKETGVFLCTAHPAKFNQVVEDILDIKLELPEELAKYEYRSLLSQDIPAKFEPLKQILRSL